MLAEQPDAEVGAKGWLDIEENAGARGRHVVDAPIP